MRVKLVGGDRTDPGVTRRLSFTADNELMVAATPQETGVWSNYTVTVSGGTDTWAVLVDLSDTDNWPHVQGGRIDVASQYVSVDRDANAVGSVGLGVVTRIDASDADVSFFDTVRFDKSDTRHIRSEQNPAPSQTKLGVADGALAHGITNDRRTGVGALNTATGVDSPNGTVVAGVGDVVVRLNRSAGTFSADVKVLYHSHE